MLVLPSWSWQEREMNIYGGDAKIHNNSPNSEMSPMNWQKRIDPSKSYAEHEIASLLGVDLHQVRCTMQVDIIRSKRRGDTWHATGADLLEWGNTAVLYDDVFAGFEPVFRPQAKVAEPAPEPIQEAPEPIAPVIYFARCGDHIKIGFTRGTPEKRLKGLSTASPFPVELVASMPGSQELERELHERFGEFHTKGEWFVFSDPIREYIASIEA